MHTNLDITLLVAAAENNAIGKDNQMLWHLPNDFKYFKKTTLGHSIIMGRKTFDSIGKALAERRNIVITRNQDFHAQDVDSANSLAEALLYCRDERQVYVVGGAQIYEQALALANEVLLTRVHTSVAGDAFFPTLYAAEWQLKSAENHEADDKHAFAYTFEVYKRK